MKSALSIASTACAAALSMSARAEEPVAEPVEPPSFTQAPADATKPTAAEDSVTLGARRRDASIDRGFTTGHAETIGEGQWAFNSYELFLAGLTYGVTDDLQLSFTTLLPITSDVPLLIGLSPKLVVHRSDRVVAALRGNVFMGVETGAGGFGGIASAGPFVDYYLDPQGRLALHGGLTVGGMFGGEIGTDLGFARGLLMTFEAGFSAAVTNNVKLLIEAQAFGLVSSAGFSVADATLVNYGVRFYGEDLAVDLAFLRPVGVDLDPLVLGVPYVTFSARF